MLLTRWSPTLIPTAMLTTLTFPCKPTQLEIDMPKPVFKPKQPSVPSAPKSHQKPVQPTGEVFTPNTKKDAPKSFASPTPLRPPPDPYEVVTQDLVTLHVRVPLFVKREARSAARESGVTLSAYVRAALMQSLSQPVAPTTAAAPEKRVGALGRVYQRLVVWFAGVRF